MRASSRAIRRDDRADPGGAGDHDVAVVFDGPYLGERELLLAHGLVERGVVAGHGQQLSAVEDRFARRAVEDHLPAGGHPDRYARGVHDVVARAGHEVAGAVGVPGQMLEEARPRQVLAERLHDLLVVAVAGPVTGFQTITVLVYSGFPACGRGVEHGADQDRRTDCLRPPPGSLARRRH